MATKELVMTPAVEEAIKTALDKPTLVGALAYIALWEHLRIMAEVKANLPVASNFPVLIEYVMKAYVWTPRNPQDQIGPEVINLPKID